MASKATMKGRDYRERLELKELIDKKRDVRPLPEDKVTEKVAVVNENKEEKIMSLKDIEDQLKANEIGELLQKGGSLPVPVVDYIKEKYKFLSVESVERLNKDLTFMHQDLISKGFTEDEVKRAINGEKLAPKDFKDKYIQYRKFLSEDSEVRVKTALQSLNLPSLIIRSVDKLKVWKGCRQLYQNLGINITVKDMNGEDEYDLQMAFVDGDTLNWILVEVKNKNSYPWESSNSSQQVKPESLLKKAWEQLAKSFTFISELFPDIAFGKVFVFTAMPNMPRQVLEKELKAECMEMILCKEDLADPKELRRRIRLDEMAPSTETGRNKLCIVASRMVGPGSDLYVPLRTPADVRPNEENQLKKEMEEVQKDTWVILNKVQKSAIKAAENDGKRIVAIEGPPGCGKTLVGEQFLKAMIEKAKKETGEDPMVIITKNTGFKEDTPLRQQLEANAEQGSQVGEWGKLLKENGIQRVRIEGRGKDYTYYNLPEEFAALGEKLMQAEQGKRRIIIMMDEVFCSHAPEDKEQAGYNWTGLDKIPDQLTIILMFNPGLYAGRHLLLPPSCLRLVLKTTYRSTKSISSLHSCLATAFKDNAPSGNPGTEVLGQIPGIVPIGNLGEGEEAAEKIRQGLEMMRGFMGKEDVTVIVDDNRLLSDNIAKLVREETERWGWKMRTVGEMTGAEADRVVCVGCGDLEPVSRARLSLGILLCCQTELSRRAYNFYNIGFRTAIEEGLVLVATLPSHPQVALAIAFQS